MDKIISQEERRRTRRRTILKYAAIAAGALAAGGILMFYSGGKSIFRDEAMLRKAELGPLESAVAASGRLVPAFEEIVISPVASRIMSVYVHAGDSVGKGTPLLQLDLSESESRYQNLRDALAIKESELKQLRLANHSALSDLEMQIEIKQMDVNRLEIEVENEERLDSLGSGTGERVRQARTAYITGKLELQGLRKRLENERKRFAALEDAAVLDLGNSARETEMMSRTLEAGRIPAPRSGVITYISTEIGSRVSQGERVAVVGDLSSFKVAAEMPEGNIHKVHAGAEAIVRLGNIELNGIVDQIEPQSKSGSVPFSVILKDSRNTRLRPGVRVQVYVAYGFKDSVVRIPMGNYFKGPGEYMLFVEDGESGKLRKRRVTRGDSNRLWVEVTGGIAPGEEVAIADMDAFESYSTLTIK